MQLTAFISGSKFGASRTKIVDDEGKFENQNFAVMKNTTVFNCSV